MRNRTDNSPRVLALFVRSGFWQCQENVYIKYLEFRSNFDRFLKDMFHLVACLYGILVAQGVRKNEDGLKIQDAMVPGTCHGTSRGKVPRKLLLGPEG